jgi:hypothetical protein
MAQLSTGGRYRLGEPLETDLADFCAANWDSSATSVIRDAVREFIDARLAAEPEMLRRFEEARKRRKEV